MSKKAISLDTTMDKLPLRKRDGARVIDATKNSSRTYSDPGKRILLKRYMPYAYNAICMTYNFVVDHKEWKDSLDRIVKGEEMYK